MLALIFAVACLVRLYPALVSGLPFSTDGWGCIRNSELLLQHTPVSLSDNSVFDGYNNYWPANSVFGAVLSEVTGLAPINVMAYGVPLAGALTVPLFFVLVRKINGKGGYRVNLFSFAGYGFPVCLVYCWRNQGDLCKPALHSFDFGFSYAPLFW